MDGNMALQPRLFNPISWVECFVHWGCPTSTSTRAGGGSSPTTTQRQTSASPKPVTTTPKTTAVRATTPPAATQPAATQPAATQQPPPAPPAVTQAPSPETSPQPAPVPSPQTPSSQPGEQHANSTQQPNAQSSSTSPGQPSESATNDTGNGASPTAPRVPEDGDQGASGTVGPGANPTAGSEFIGSNQQGQSGVPGALAPTASASPGVGGDGGAGGTPGLSGAASDGASHSGLPPGAIAGIVVGLLVLLALFAFLLYRLRRTPAVQRLLAPFSKLGGGGDSFHRMETPVLDSMGRNLLSPSPGIPATAAAAAAATGAGAVAAATRSPLSQLPMSQTSHLQPLAIPSGAGRRDSNRISVFTTNSASTGAFTPSPVSPHSPAGMPSPGAVRTSQPVQAPPDPRVMAAANAHVSKGSISSGSNISAALAPGQMKWPIPPTTPPVIRHPDGPQYLSFDQSGQTVVRINQPPRNQRSGGY